MLLLALLAPWAANAQETLTVHDGTTTNNYVPAYGMYVDTYGAKSEFIISAETEGMSDLEGATITKLTFYISGSPASWGSPTIQVYMGEVEGPTMSAMHNPSDFTIVSTSVWSNQSSTIEVEFDEPYTYEGGNLLIGTFVQTASSAYKTTSFYGISATSGSSYYFSGGTWASPTAQSFLPKTTITYEPAQQGGDVCEKPSTCEASDVTATSAILTWGGGSGVYNVEVKGGSYADWTTLLSNTNLTTTTLTLDPITSYQARVQSVCDGTTPTSGWKTSASFTTLCANTVISTFPVIYTFETDDGFPANASTPTTNPFNCWRNEATVQNGNNPTRVWGTSTTHKNGSQSLTLPDKGNSSNPAKTMLVFPAMNFTSANGYVVSFWVYRNGSSSNPEGFKVYASDCDTIGANAVELGHYSRNYGIAYPQVESTSNWYYYETDAITMTGTTYIIFEGQSYFGNATYVDDVTIKVAPTCFNPTEAHADVADANNATISWTPNPLNAAGGSYSILDAELNVVSGAEQLTGTSFSLSGLNPETDYTYYVRTNCFNSEEDVNVELVEVSFSTPADCAAPVLEADAFTNVSAHQATVSWTGFASNNEFVVSYRSAAYLDGITEEFGATSIPEGWTMYTGLLVGNTAELVGATYGWGFGSGNGVFDNHARVNIYGNYQRWLVTPAITISNNAVLNFDMALTAFSGNLSAPQTDGTDDKFIVLISTDNKSTWTTLREWNNSGSAYVYNEIANSATGENVNIDLSSYAGQSAYIAFYGESTGSNADNNLHIDNVAIGTAIPAGDWQTVSPNPTTASTTLTGLTAATPYDVKVKGLCNGGNESEESDIQTFTTTIACPQPNTLTVDANADDPTIKEDLTWVMTGAETDWQLCLNGDEENLIDINESEVSINPTTHEVSYTLSGLTPGQDYTVKVRANCEASVPGDQTSDWSNTQNFQTEATCVEPTDFAHGTVDAHNAPLSWTEAGAATQWQICINDDMDNLILISNTTTGVTVEDQNVSYTLTGLTAETDYTVKLRAYCADGDGNQSPWVTTSFTTLVACPAPTNLQVEANALDATFSWEGEAGSYVVVTSMNSSDNPSDLVSTPVTGNNYIFTNLELGNHYFWVRSNCSANGEGYSSWAGPFSVHIGYCVPNPTSHDGSGITGVTFGMGSNVVENGDGTTSLPASSPFYGDYSSMIGAVQAGVESTISITTATGTYPYTFVIWVDLDNSLSFEDSEVLYVGKAASGVGTLNATITIPATQATGDYRMRIYGADSYFNNFYNNGSTNWEAAHDPCVTGSYRHAHDYTVRVLEAPSCLTPTNVEVTYTGGTTATISWTSEATAWNMRVNGVDVNGVITNPYTLTGLELATTYSVEVQANCGANGLSEWSTPANFTTDLCQSENMCAINYSFTDQYNDSWNNAYMNIVDALTGEVLYQLTMPSVAGPYEGSFNVCDGRDIQFVWVSGNYPNECGYVFTDINGEVILEKATGTTAPAAGVVITYTVDCTLPTCAKPTALNATAITNNSATLSWTANSGETAWTLYYKKTTDENYTEVTENVTNPYTLTVEASTEYIFYVVANCSETEESEPSATFTFTTQCNPITVDADNPFTENFDAGTFPPTDCWNTISNDTYNWTINASENHNEGGSASAYSGYYGDIYLIMPTLAIADNEGPVKLTFWSYNTYTSDYGKNSVVLLGNTETELWTPASVSDSWEETTIDLSAYKGQNITLAFKYEGDNAHGWYVDDVWVGYLPSYTKVVESGKWYAISSPVNTPAVNEVDNLTDGNYDFYRYDEASATWENYKADHSDFTTFENGRGYIYRRDGNKNLTFTGFPNTAANYFLTANRADDLKGFNLLGNPFANPYTYGGNCYALTEKGTWMAKTNYTIPVCEAILVKVNITTNYVFSPATKSAPKAVEALAFTVSGNGYEDVTYAMLEEGEGLTKVAHLATEAPALSIPVDGSNYAIAYLGYEVESFPLTLNAQAGEYTIALNNQISGLSYCHLLDKETGKETDLLKGAYTFKANGNSNRFTVLLNASLENGEIAIWNGNSWIVNGEGTLQVFDVMGRRVYNQEVAGQSSLNTDELATGVYVIRLGEKSQKIVVK